MEYTITLDRERKLKYGFKALRLLRQRFSAPVEDVLQNISVDQIPAFIWAGLIWEEPDLRVERVEELLDEKVPEKYTMLQITEIVSAAMTSHLGASRGGEARPFVEKKMTSSPIADELPSKSD